MYCKKCGKEIDEKAVICVGCGALTKLGINQSQNAHVKLCKECNQQVSRDAAKCPHCGKRLKTSGCGIVILVIVGFIFLSYIIGLAMPSKYYNKTPVLSSEDLETHNQNMAKIKDYVLIEADNGRVVKVKPLWWNRQSLTKKESIARTCAYQIYIETGYNYCNVIDYYSGKKLAYYGSWGFKTY